MDSEIYELLELEEELTDDEAAHIIDEYLDEYRRGTSEQRLAKPIYLMSTKRVKDHQYDAVRDGIETVLDIVGVDVEICDLPRWYHCEGAYMNAEWYVENAETDKNCGFGRQVNCDVLLRHLHIEPWKYRGPKHRELLRVASDGHFGSCTVVRSLGYRKQIIDFEGTADELRDIIHKNHRAGRYNIIHGAYMVGEGLTLAPHYDVFVVDKDLMAWGSPVLVGGAQEDVILSVVRFDGIPEEYECIKTETMHELGHLFDAAAGRRCGVDALTREFVLVNGKPHPTLGADHCANECVMRQGLAIPTAWIKMSKDWLESGEPFCDECVEDMQNYFKGFDVESLRSGPIS